MDTAQQSEINDSTLTAARRLHPEDIQIGDNVALAHVSYQYPSFLWCGVDLAMLPADRIVQLSFLPSEFELLVVKSICLPFVFCKSNDGQHKVFDLRQSELMKVDRAFAASVRKGHKLDSRSSKNGKKKKRQKRKRKSQ